MKTFIGASAFRIIIILGGRIYMSNYQSDALYSFLELSNPATKAVTQCYSGFEAVGAGLDSKLDRILNQIEETDSGSTTGDILSGTTTTGAINKIFYASGTKNN